MNDKWTIMHCSTAQSLEELSDTTFDELQKAIEEEKARREKIRYDRAQKLQEQIINLMQQAENEGFRIIYCCDKIDPSDIWVQY